MQRKHILCVVSWFLFLTGCAGVVSLHPLAVPNAKETVFDAALLGDWETVKTNPGSEPCRYKVERAESGYRVTLVTDEEKIEGTMHLVKLGEHSLLDVLSPGNGAPPPVHLFLRVRFDGDAAWLSEMNTPWLKDQIEMRPQLRHEVLIEGGEKVVLTASTAELWRHLVPLAGDDRSFGREFQLRRVK